MSLMLNRRSVLKATLMAPFAILLPRLAFSADAKHAAAMPDLTENDPLGGALKYKADASKAGPERADKKATCANCAKFNKCSPADSACKPVAKNSPKAPCEIFMGKQVSAKGWCMSWTKVG
jgi:hypothetical protein